MKVLIGYDGSEHAGAAIEDLTRAGLPHDAQATVLASVEWPTVQSLRSWGMVETDFSPEWLKRIEAAKELAESGAERVRKLFPAWTVETEASAGNPADSLLDKAREWSADLIVVGTHGRSALGRALLGSVSTKLAHEAPCPVRVARAPDRKGPIHLLIGADGSPEADAILAEVRRRPWPAGSEARIVAVQNLLVAVNAERMAIGENLYERINQDARRRLNAVLDAAAKSLDGSGLAVSTELIEGNPKDVLLREAHDWPADVVFIGARGLGRVEGLLLGSVSTAVVNHAPCSVEVIHRRR